MATFNQYNLYSYAAGQMSTACDDKILVDLHRLNNMDDFCVIDEYLTKTFGEVSGQKVFKYPNDIQVIVAKEDNLIMVGALQKDKEIFKKGWKYIEE